MLTYGKRREIQINTTDINLISYSDDDEPRDEVNVITPQNFRRRLTITDISGDSLNSPEARILFNCKKN